MTRDVIDRSSRFFIQVPNDLVREIENATAFFVYSILKTYTNGATNTVFPSRETIAKIMGAKTTKPVDTALKELRRLGLVATFPRWLGDDGSISRKKDATHSRQTSNGYILYDRINLTPPEGWDDPEGRPPKRDGVGVQKGTPGGVQKEAPRVSQNGHEVYPPEVHPSEVDKTPVVPTGAPAEKGKPGTEIIESSDTTPVAPGRQETNTGSTKSRGTRLPEKFFPTDHTINLIRAQFPGITEQFLIAEHAKFLDHWAAAPGAKGRKVDWEATWRNWIRNSIDRLRPAERAMFTQQAQPAAPQAPQQPSKADQYRDIGDMIAAEFAQGGDGQ